MSPLALGRGARRVEEETLVGLKSCPLVAYLGAQLASQLNPHQPTGE